MATVYKIRDRKTGLYSTGGTWPNWNAKGKVWTTTSAVSNHLGLGGMAKHYQGCEVVEIEVTYKEVAAVSVDDRLQANRNRKAAREQKRKEKAEEVARAHDLALLANLKARYPGS